MAAAAQAATGSVVTARIDTAALIDNARTVAARVAPAQLMAVVKADAYGHSTDIVAPALYAAGLRDFAVAAVPEAVALSQLLGPDSGARILCWLFDPAADLTVCTRAGIELGISTPEALEAAIAAGRATGRTQDVHLKLDTGLGRNGLSLPQLETVLDRLRELATATGTTARATGTTRTSASAPVRVTGIMTHFANADIPGDPATVDQLHRFDTLYGRLQAELPHALRADDLMVTLANSPAALSLNPVPGSHVRAGISLYGISPFEDKTAAQLGLTPVMTLTSRVLNVKDVPAGHGASYGLTYRCERDTRFALVAGGYGDGLPRIAGNRGEVAIGGRRYPIVGRIAMDQMILDIGPAGDGGQVAIGDEVIIIGDGTTGPSAEEWADWCETINYEIVTCISARVDRITIGADAASAPGDRARGGGR
ncbi:MULTISPECIES: alanine racemase [Brevibacterium]|uniref:alanine racemase n=1 Tax=Brevibacterium TaxID=1696 RepID=UPI0021AF2BC8|nr:MULTISPECIES: alanine racemase [Brevibacterium]MCT1873481.1 alanine racemase [Brevibacterium luteolum]MCT1890869.1 alanine racemase [Brevibacterium luteolum]MCT1893335.1 alanine racemase [Brevibacterium luteolum]MCT1924095.1 alanine racemase [Brevibacterium luteolum]